MFKHADAHMDQPVRAKTKIDRAKSNLLILSQKQKL